MLLIPLPNKRAAPPIIIETEIYTDESMTACGGVKKATTKSTTDTKYANILIICCLSFLHIFMEIKMSANSV